MFEDPLCSPLASMAWTPACPRGHQYFTLGNFITDATVRPSHGRPYGHRPTVRPSIRYRPHDNPNDWTNTVNSPRVYVVLHITHHDIFRMIMLRGPSTSHPPSMSTEVGPAN
jgi:hypothetical protein